MHYLPYIISRVRSAIARMRGTARSRYLVATFLALSALAGTLSAHAAAAASDQRCFTETSFCTSGRIRTFWEHNGGLAIFGLPLGPQHEELVEGQALLVQLFERNRLELHPENQAPYDVELGRMGEEVLVQQGRDWRGFSHAEGAPAVCRFFAETGHSLCEPFLSYWRANGLEFDGQHGTSEAESLALFGLPLGDPQVETNSSGDSVLTQWFERARFEFHANNPAPYQVLLGRLGAEHGDEHEHPAPTPCNPERNPDCHREPTEPPHEPTATPCNPERNPECHREEPTPRPCDREHDDGCEHREPTQRPTEPPHEPTATPCNPERNPDCHREPTARPTEPPHEPTARPTEPPHEPTARPTEPPHEPTARPTEPPHEPTATPRR